MTTRTHDDILSMVERWVRHELPLINRGTEAHGDVQFLIGRCQLPVEAIAHAARDTRDPETAMRLLQLLGFAVSSVERHMQAGGAAPGEGVAALHAAGLLIQLGELADHAPRDSHDTYWTLNRDDLPLTFTGLSQESVMIRIMNEMQHLYGVSAAALRPICGGDLSITSRTALEAMEFAAASIDRVTLLLHSFLSPAMQKEARSARQFEVFAMTLAMYLCDYPVGAQTWLAPDPANIPGPMELDLTIGTGEGRRDLIARRMTRLSTCDRGRVIAAMQRPSLAARVAEAAGLTEEEVGRMPEADVARHMAARPGLLGVLKSYARLAAAADTCTSWLEVVYDHLGPMHVPLSGAKTRNVKTLVQRVDEFATLAQVVEFRTSDPTVRRLVAAAQG